MSEAERSALVDPIFDAIARDCRAATWEAGRREIHKRFQDLEERVLSHFRTYGSGPGYVSKTEAWSQACRQREFVREACARMAEGEGGMPTNLSEAIRAIDVGEHVRVIPDYSMGVSNG
ncbi:MAG: hypothetical protein IBJ07_08690 [Rhizobiaceae bacterium]|nr:hypothetical protein [Rhizobiaceae bacterium]